MADALVKLMRTNPEVYKTPTFYLHQERRKWLPKLKKLKKSGPESIGQTKSTRKPNENTSARISTSLGNWKPKAGTSFERFAESRFVQKEVKSRGY
jgi:hypothetical protein